MSISSKELASILGVSPSTVSMALNDRPGISEETKAQILHAANQYGLEIRKKRYSSSRSHAINFVQFKKHGLVLGDTPFFAELAESVASEANQLGYKLQLTYFYANQNIREQLHALKSSGSDGIILLATEMDDTDIRHFQALEIPIILLDGYFPHANYDCVCIDNTQGADIAASYLLAKGHRKLGILSSKTSIANFEERHEGFYKAIAHHTDITDNLYTNIRVGSTSDSAYTDMCDYLRTKPLLPTALFADNDIIASSCMRALREYGYHIPQDISIVGFDNMPFAQVTVPQLTTIHVPKEYLGICAVKRLVERLNNPNLENITIRISTKIIERGTVHQRI